MTLPWIILFVPLASAALIVCLTQRARNLSAYISVGAVLVSFVCSLVVVASQPPEGANEFAWMDFRPAFNFYVPFGVTIDELSRLMLLVVTGIGSLIHIYSLGYMSDDEGKSRYFACLSLFMFSMLGIVLANNFVMMFVFWELVGVSSYLLIGHWFTRDAAADAAKKAFITNRIGDFGFMLGILMFWALTGSVVFADMQSTHDTWAATLTQNPAYLTIASLLIFCGAVGKSAQFPLHVWLPDAMEGPTPVSALIHAATMVAAGVYMLARVSVQVGLSETALQWISWVGIITAVLAALMATQQDDIKRILAYSTLSQLGYMVTAVGLAATPAAMFHLFTHAFFKALLFLGAGSVIHALHHEQDIWKMGGLKRPMFTTFATFGIGTLALAGLPGFSGFFSKDLILLAAYEHNKVIFLLAVATAFLTAFYMFRLLFVVFFGEPRSDAAKKGHESPLVMTGPLIVLAIPSVIAGYTIEGFLTLPQEEEHSMLVPVLSSVVFALGTGSAYLLYWGKSKDPVRIPLFANKFYFDELYAFLIRITQEALAKFLDWFDRWVIDGAGVRGASGGTWSAGFVLRLLQIGNLQAYAFLFGLGVIVLIYFTLFR